MVKTKKIWLDGKLVDWKKATVHALTYTLHYGVGVFEGIRSYRQVNGGSAVFRLREHVDRLFDSAHIATIKIPFTRKIMTDAIVKTLRANNLKEGYIRPIVFIGDGEMGLFAWNNPIRAAVAVWPWGSYLGEKGLKNGIRVKIASCIRPHVNSEMSRAKICGNYVNSVLAKKEAVSTGYDEALLLDTEGYIAEGSGENIFIVKNGVLKTTPLTAVLPGITRDSVMTIARDRGLEMREERFTRDELYIADEAFFTGTAAEITPIREVDGRKIGRGKRGQITAELQEVFFDIVKGRNPDYFHWLNPY